ncbi:hypothetical protein E1301_Tti002203 [Triplophysa tibetana]|uniref:C2H2-type domain-containing protein n=1 Tax=Triplophysa tibetana TaxID=1572043 RepID=A0A5A9NBX4_9TELE|nr:hypothetical protein E1301_Tti002203 [Triplophysa tibetana]
MRTQIDVMCCKSVGTDLSMLDIDDLMTEISQLKKEVALLEAKLGESDELSRKDVSGVSLCVITDQTSPELLVSVCHEEQKPSGNLLDCQMELDTDITETEEQTDADLIHPDLMKEEITEHNEMEDKPPFVIGEESPNCLKTDTNFSLKKSQGEPNKDFPMCQLCGKTFKCRSHMNHHMKIHTGEKPYRCDHCGKIFARKYTLNVHMIIHTEVRLHTCNQCGKTFKHRSSMNDHMKIHTGEKPYRCDHCGKIFARKDTLNGHMITHTGVRLYTCNQCGKTFKRRSHMNNHMKIHTGEKPYRCDQCGKTFQHKYIHDTHMRSHTGGKPYSCDQCGKVFTWKSNLTRHMRVHTG